MSPEDINCRIGEALEWTGFCQHCVGGLIYHFDGNGEYTSSESCPCGGMPVDPPNFHTDLNAAMQVVEKAKEMGWRWYAKSITEGTFLVSFSAGPDESIVRAEASTLSAAICEAFLKLLDQPAEKP